MIKACDIARSSIVEIDGMPHRVESIQVQTPSARGGATLYKIRFRNVQTGQKTDKNMRGEETLQEAHYQTRPVQFLYQNGDLYTFMDLNDYSQFDLTKKDIEDALPYLVEDLEGINLLESDGRVLGLVLPDVVEMEIVKCDPSMKGASATARTKPATLSTGLIVQIPEYLAQGETIRIDTRTDTFIGRA